MKNPVKKYGKLTDFGKKVIEEMNNQEIIIDIAHSCEETAFDAIEHSNQPIIASHTGALALQPNFPRYIYWQLAQTLMDYLVSWKIFTIQQISAV